MRSPLIDPQPRLELPQPPATSFAQRLGLVTVLVVLVLLGPALTAGAELAQSVEGEAISGRLVNGDDGEPVAGVEILVSTEGGEEVGTITSDEDGEYLLELPGEGRYVAQLQVDSLPRGVKLTDPDKTALTFTVLPDQQKPLLFPFGEDTRDSASTLDRIVPLVISGLRTGLILAMSAIGLSLVYGTTRFTNFAHGEMVTFGALLAWLFNQTFGLPLLIAAPIAVVLCGVSGAGLEVGLWRPMRRRGSSLFGLMIISLGLSIVVQHFFLYVFGSRTRPYSDYAVQRNGLRIGAAIVQPKVFGVILISAVVMLAIGAFLSRARFGKAMRAVADNGPLASSSGIDIDQVVLWVWIGGSAAAGLGGILYSVTQQVSFAQGQNLLLLMFAGATLGGLGTAFGAAGGCILLGLLIELSTLVIPTSMKNVGALAVLILILLFKPEGLFGRRERVG